MAVPVPLYTISSISTLKSIGGASVRTPGVKGGLLAAVPAGVPGRLEHLIGEVARGDTESFFYQHHRVDPVDPNDTVTPEQGVMPLALIIPTGMPLSFLIIQPE